MLAKLMATENIKVEHHNCQTASFNLKTRTLTCPIWKNMSGDLYDLLMGHEISHALRTPLQGWHDSVIYAGGDTKATPQAQKAFKHFLNIAEDARIEKLVKRQYPGLRKPMLNGYKELLAKDFFGLSAIENYNELYLIDKLNLAAKCGTALNIRFKAKEKAFYDELMALETWDQVVVLARKLYEYSKQEQKEGEKKRKELADHLKDSLEYAEDGEEGEEDEYDEDYDDEETDSDGDSDDEDDDEDDEEGEDGNDEEDDKDQDEGESSSAKGKLAGKDEEEKADDKTTEQKAGKGADKKKKQEENDKQEKGECANGVGGDASDDFVPKAKSDEAFRDKETQLVDSDKIESCYITIPTVNLKDLVTPAATVNAGLNAHYFLKRDKGLRLFSAFKKKNEDYISLLAKEFEMKKAARSYAKAKISDSGDINVNKLANYRLEDDIFKKMMVVHKGKSHGLVLILDKSGSMGPHIEGAMEQIIVMALFCRKVNIPFVAYSFTSCSSAQAHDFKGVTKHLAPYSTEKNDLAMGHLNLREMFNSKMPANDFTQALMNHLMVANGLSSNREFDTAIPSHESMGGTPLNESLVALRDVIRTFKKVHNLHIVNAIIVHDGDSDGNNAFYEKDTNNNPYTTIKKHFNHEYCRVTLVDKKENYHIPVPREQRGMTIALMQWLQMSADCGVFGFFITGGTVKSAKQGISYLYQNKEGIGIRHVTRYRPEENQMLLIDELGRKLIDQKFLESWTSGYTRFYFIPGESELKVQAQDIIIEPGKNWTPSRLLSAFKKVNKKRHVSRVLVNKFIELMAT